MRKFTVIAYLNPDLSSITDKNVKLGELRLYLDKEIVDVIPHLGRVIIFKSEIVEHEVKPTKGYERYALTSWYRHIHRAEEKKSYNQQKDETIFIGIPSYRDPELPETVANIIETADNPELLNFGICF
jgi:hypothetical protein